MVLNSYSPNELAVLATIIAILLCENLTLDEQNVLGNFFQSIGQCMFVINAQLSNMQSQQQASNDSNTHDLQKQIDDLKKCIKTLEHKMN